MELVVGVDAGGTSSRAVVATVAGEIVGRGAAGPGNPLSAGAGPASASVASAVRQALGGHSPGLVAAGVLGIAGPATAAQFAPAWAALGLTAPMRVVGDVVTAFAAGSPARAGAVLIAGTGAIAAEVIEDSVARTVDGLGWLLGDRGSGRWVGLAACRVAVRNWSAPFAARVAAHAGVGTSDELVRWAQALPLSEIGALAPVVCAEARAGDPLAGEIVNSAVGHLLQTLDDLAADGPTVLAGSLLAADTPIRDGVAGALRARGLTPHTSRDPAAAAAWLAARPRSPLPPPALHAALLN